MKVFQLAILCCSITVLACKAPQSSSSINPDQEEWLSLFNGKDLEGWDIKITGRPLGDNYLNTFRVEDGIMRLSYDEYDQFGTYFGHLYYKEAFSHYKIRFEYRFVGEQTPGGASWNVRNSGIMLHSQSAASVGIDQQFPVSIEVQLLGGLDEGERTTGNLCTPGTMVEMNGELTRQHCISSTSQTYHGDQWVSMEAVVYGDSIVHHIIGTDTILTYQRPQIDGAFVSKTNLNWEEAGVPNPDYWMAQEGTTVKEGYIALQAESHPIDFRKVELLNLTGCMDSKAKNYKSYFVQNKAESCIY